MAPSWVQVDGLCEHKGAKDVERKPEPTLGQFEVCGAGIPSPDASCLKSGARKKSANRSSPCKILPPAPIPLYTQPQQQLSHTAA